MHGDNGSAVVFVKVDAHTKEDVVIAASDSHFVKMGFESVENTCNNRRVPVRDFGIIDIPAAR
jgi:hypothetical protein